MYNLEIPSEVNENDYVDYDYVTTYFLKVDRQIPNDSDNQAF